MKKPFLLIAGDAYYPSSGTGDWIGCFETQKEAEEQVDVVEHHTYYTKGKNKGEIKSTHKTYVVKGGTYGDRNCDWYEIVDLLDWTR
jgi:hypothetical protein